MAASVTWLFRQASAGCPGPQGDALVLVMRGETGLFAAFGVAYPPPLPSCAGALASAAQAGPHADAEHHLQPPAQQAAATLLQRQPLAGGARPAALPCHAMPSPPQRRRRQPSRDACAPHLQFRHKLSAGFKRLMWGVFEHRVKQQFVLDGDLKPPIPLQK